MKLTCCWGFLLPLLLGLLLASADAKGTFYGNPYRYNLFKAGLNPTHYNPGKPMSRHKNYCAYIVQKNITCTVQDGVATYVKADYTTKCIWGQKCPVLMYRTFFKPKYKLGYKTVTELEWRCCPGHSGDNCLGGSSTATDGMLPPFKGSVQGPRPPFKGFPHGQPRFPPDQALIPGSGLEPGKPFPYPDNRPIPSGHLPAGGPKTGYGPKAGGVSGERLDRMEEDLRRLSQGLDTLNGLVAGLEDRLRVSLREDTTKMITTLLGSPRRPDSTVGFGVIPEGGPETLDGGEGFPVLGELVGRVTEVKDELRVKSNMLDEIHGMVMGHDGQLKRLLEADTARPVLTGGTQSLLEELLDARLAGVKAEILDGFERRLSGLENHCDERIGQVQQQCEKEHLNGQEQMQLSLDGRETGLRKELGDLQAQIQGLTLTDNCCGQVNSLSQRVLLLEESVKGLTESQRQLQVTLTEQTHHMETQLDARLLDIEGRLNTSDRGEGRLEGFDGHGAGTLDGFKTLLDDKLKNLEERLFVAVEELSNATAPALLEGHVVPALETEIDNVRRRVEADLDGLQKQLTDLELLCTSACSPAPNPEVELIQTEMEECKDVEKKVSSRLDTHSDMLDHLNRTLQGLLTQLAQEDQEGSLQGEITLLKINVNSVNRTLKGLRDSVHFFAREIGHANSTWEEREHRLATQVKGITELVGRQSNLLGAGERRLIQMKAELQSLRRRLAGEIRECRSTALGVQQEVMGVESRVSQVEGRCGSLSELADELERIRSELESHSDTYLAQINNTLASHGQQLSQLKEGLQECANKTDPDSHRGDQ
ncbi:EMILIN-3 [Astyanax mexicanus]|uniref:EMILIN-3 n=2 Tax=Astyanax mexicanus TaxID=7994 RepID=A0A8T2LKE4_ASTMX|nr:EMILIN-3 [Astyanax mexicanus]